MKKLALALVCFASVAFFASCTPEVTNPEPTLTIINGDNYVYDGQTIDLNTDYQIGFRAASNAQTTKELASFNLSTKLFDLEGTETYAEDTTYTISGSEYEYQETLNFTVRELIGKATITASVTDVDGKIKTAVINLNINQPAVALEVKDFEWFRKGNTIKGVEEYGLQWKGNYPRDTYAKLIPMEGVKLFAFTMEDWESVTTDLDKAAFFSEASTTQHQINEYFNVNVTQQDEEYNDVIGTIMPDGTCHMMLVEKSHSVYTTATETTIYGKSK